MSNQNEGDGIRNSASSGHGGGALGLALNKQHSVSEAEFAQQQQLLARNNILKMDYKLLQKYPIVSMFVVPACPYVNTTTVEVSSGADMRGSGKGPGAMAATVSAETEDLENTPLSKWHVVYFVKQGLY